MRVGIVGTNWGRTHVGTFRRAGVEVWALVGTDGPATAAVAAAEGVPVGTAAVGVLEEVDVVVVATPTRTHRELVERFAHKPVLCEKPLIGGAAEAAFATGLAGAQVWVNYAFPFLATAAQVRDHVVSRQVTGVELRVRTSLPAVDDALVAWREVAVHPLAFISQLFGPFESSSQHRDGDTLEVVLENTHHRARVRVEPATRPGIDIDVDMTGPDVRAELRGGYHPGEGWAFAPARLDGVAAAGPGERSTADTDVWYEANCRCVAAFVDIVRGTLSPTEAAELGATHATTALAIERVLDETD